MRHAPASFNPASKRHCLTSDLHAADENIEAASASPHLGIRSARGYVWLIRTPALRFSASHASDAAGPRIARRAAAVLRTLFASTSRGLALSEGPVRPSSGREPICGTEEFAHRRCAAAVGVTPRRPETAAARHSLPVHVCPTRARLTNPGGSAESLALAPRWLHYVLGVGLR